jgi:protein phosphatase
VTGSSPVRAAARTHVGQLRKMNEDAYALTDRVFAVADGMGGHLAGEVASAMAIERLSALTAGADVSTDDVVHAVLGANFDILDMSERDSSRRGMGTTLTGVVLMGDGAHREFAVVNVGDSRTYRLRDGRLTQISVDHSYVHELVMLGHLTLDQARVHPQRNIVTRALGIEPGVGVDVWTQPLVRGDRYLMCSDGLVDEVTDSAIAGVLATVSEPGAAAQRLVDLANAAGGRDNITVVVVDVLDGLEPGVVTENLDYHTVQADLDDTSITRTEEMPAVATSVFDTDFSSGSSRVVVEGVDATPSGEIGPLSAFAPADVTGPIARSALEATGKASAARNAAADAAELTEHTEQALERALRRRQGIVSAAIVGSIAIAVALIVVISSRHSRVDTPITTVTTTVATTVVGPTTSGA